VAQMQQQLRGALYIMEQDIRIAGYDPEGSGLFGVTDVRRYSLTNVGTTPAVDQNGLPALTVAFDWNPDDATFDSNGLLDEPTPAYRLFDETGDGILELARDFPGDRQLLAENVEAMGFAYAYDADGDGAVERVGNNIIWAVDSDNDNFLDTNLDANNDGVIDLADDTDGDFRVTSVDGAGVGPVPVSSIRMVRIWLLVRANRPSQDFNNNGASFLVGDQIVPAQAAGFTDNIRRRLLVKTLECRNTGI